MARLSLDQIDVAEPCSVPWESMAGTRVRRFCAHCQKDVFDLSAMTRTDAESLVCQSAGNLCAQFRRGPDGSIVTLDYLSAKDKGWTWRAWTLIGLAGALVTGVVHAALFGDRVFPMTARGGIAIRTTPPVGPYAASYVPPVPYAALPDDFDLTDTPSAISDHAAESR